MTALEKMIEDEKNRIADLEQKIKNGYKYCYDCIHYSSGYCCGYDSKYCKVYGSLDMDQKERHPDKTANTCKDYKQKEGIVPFAKHFLDSAIDYLKCLEERNIEENSPEHKKQKEKDEEELILERLFKV